MRLSVVVCLVILATLASGCGRASGSERHPADSEAAPAAAGAVDSLRPIEEEILRFREAVSDVPEGLTGGELTRDALVRRWVNAVETRDSVGLTRILLSAAEYITFYYPASPYAQSPYRQSPGVRWFLMSNSSSQGASRVWERHAGRPLGFAGNTCAPTPELVGENRIWTDCVLRLKTAEGESRIRLFGPIIEREGRFKFLTYASDY